MCRVLRGEARNGPGRTELVWIDRHVPVLVETRFRFDVLDTMVVGTRFRFDVLDTMVVGIGWVAWYLEEATLVMSCVFDYVCKRIFVE